MRPCLFILAATVVFPACEASKPDPGPETVQLPRPTVVASLETAAQALLTGHDMGAKRTYPERRDWACTGDEDAPPFLSGLGGESYKICHRGDLLNFWLAAVPPEGVAPGWCVAGEHIGITENVDPDTWVFDAHRLTVQPFAVESLGACRGKPSDAVWQLLPYPNDPLRSEKNLFVPHRVERAEVWAPQIVEEKYDECCTYASRFDSDGLVIWASAYGHGGSPDEPWSVGVETPQHQLTFQATFVRLSPDRTRVYYGQATEMPSEDEEDPEVIEALQGFADRLGVTLEEAQKAVYYGGRSGMYIDELVEVDLASGSKTPLGMLTTALEALAPGSFEVIFTETLEARAIPLEGGRLRLQVDEGQGMRMFTVTPVAEPVVDGLKLVRQPRK